MLDLHLRKNGVLWSLRLLLKPKQQVWVNALDPRHPEGRFRFEARIPIEDIVAFAEEGELYAMYTEDWDWVGCDYRGDWFRFVSTCPDTRHPSCAGRLRTAEDLGSWLPPSSH